MANDFNTTSDDENKQLLRDFCAGDEKAFETILEQNKDGLYGFIRRFVIQQDLVEDVFQETFLQLYQSRSSFDPEKPLKPWLFTIAANKAKDLLRKRKRDSNISVGVMADNYEASIDDVFNTLVSDDETPHDLAILAETKDNVRAIIDEMPENLKGILILAYFEQFSYKQMAEILSIPIGTVKSRLHSAVAHFARKWKEMNNLTER